MISEETSRGLVITRIFDVPRELVWKAWTDPNMFMRRWGPRIFTSPSCRMDFRVGGKYLFCMRSPDGKNFWSTGIHREIVPLERIVYTDCFADEKGNVVPGSHYAFGSDFPLENLVTVTFEESEGARSSPYAMQPFRRARLVSWLAPAGTSPSTNSPTAFGSRGDN